MTEKPSFWTGVRSVFGGRVAPPATFVDDLQEKDNKILRDLEQQCDELKKEVAGWKRDKAQMRAKLNSILEQRDELLQEVKLLRDREKSTQPELELRELLVNWLDVLMSSTAAYEIRVLLKKFQNRNEEKTE